MFMGFPGGSMVKNLPAYAGDTGDMGSIPGSGRSPGGGNGNPLQYSCLGNLDREAWKATVYGVTRVRHDLVTEHTGQHICIYTTICIHNFNMYGKVKLKMLVSQSSLTVFDPMDCSPPGSYILGIPQARILETVAIPFSNA